MIALFAGTGIVDCLFLRVIILGRAVFEHFENVKKTSIISLRADCGDVSERINDNLFVLQNCR